MAIINKEFSKEQVLVAEVQHYLRSNIGRLYREKAAISSRLIGGQLFELLNQTAQEECQYDESGPSHVDLIRNFLLANGVTQTDLNNALPTPGNAAAMALYKDIADRGPLQHMIGAGCVEFYYSRLSPKIFEVYTDHFGFSVEEAKTYQLHGPMDEEHGERALTVLNTPLAQVMAREIDLAIRDAFAATSLHYDGMFQAAVPGAGYWSGK